MPIGKEMRSRTFRWREITISDHNASNIDVVKLVSKWLDDKDLCFIKVEHVDPQTVNLAYSPSFSDMDREIIYEEVKKAFPKSNIFFYGEEAVVILRSAICLDNYIQGSSS